MSPSLGHLLRKRAPGASEEARAALRNVVVDAVAFGYLAAVDAEGAHINAAEDRSDFADDLRLRRASHRDLSVNARVARSTLRDQRARPEPLRDPDATGRRREAAARASWSAVGGPYTIRDITVDTADSSDWPRLRRRWTRCRARG